MGYLALKRPPLTKNTDSLKLLVGLNLAVLLLYGLSVFIYGYATETGAKVSWTEAAILFIALSWDILFSGHHITNREGWLFPRQSKVLLFFGYATLTATSVLFWTSIQDAPQLKTIIERGSDPEHFVQLGIAVLGPSLLICLSILRLGPHVFNVATVPSAHTAEIRPDEGAPPFWKKAVPVLLPLVGVALLFWLPFQEWSEPKRGPEEGQHASAEAKALFDEGARLWRTGHQIGATKPFFAAAQAGYAPAQLQIGWQYEKGIGVPQSSVEAARWYRAAADRGQPQAMSNLALLYELGQGVPEDWVASAKWRQRSAQLGNVYGEAALARAYQFGIGVPQNRQLAIEWDERAARQGDQNSAYFMRWLANPRNGVGFRTTSEKDLLAARFGSAERIPAAEPRGIAFHNSNERMAWLLRQQGNQPIYTNRRPPSQRTDCCPCGPQMSDAQCFMKCNALIPRCPY